MSDPSFEKRAEAIRQRVLGQGFMALVGAELDDLSPGGCSISVAKRPELLQQYAMFHGGVTAFLIDNGTTIAASTMVQPGFATLTAEYKLNLLSPAVGERLVCHAKVVRPGRTLTIVSADVFSVLGETRKHTATALATIAVIDASTLRRP